MIDEKSIRLRLEEIGHDEECISNAFNQGEMTKMFLEEGYVAVSFPSVRKNRIFLYAKDAKFHEAYLDATDPHTPAVKL